MVPLGNLIQDLTTGEFERRMKGALVTMRLTLKRLRERASFTGDPGRYVIKGFRYRHLHRRPFTSAENLQSGWRFIY